VGTTGCKAGVFSEDARPLAFAYREYPTLHPAPELSELDSRSVWESVKAVISEVAGASSRDPVSALSVSSMGEAAVPLSRGREILGRSILSSDPRGGEFLAPLKEAYTPGKLYEINPNIVGPNYTLPKLLWHREFEPELFEKTDFFLLWADAVAFLLGAGPSACHSLANRTLMFDIRREDWSDEIIAMFEIPRGKLGAVVAAGEVIGEVSESMSRVLGLPPRVRIVSGGHDQCCNALGAGVCRAGQAVCGIGSYECITPVYSRLPEPAQMLSHGLNIEHHVLPGLYASFLYNQSGTLLKWFRDVFAATEPVPGSSIYARLDAEMPREPTRLLALPCFEMTGAPHFISDAAGAIVGLKTWTARGEIFKCLLESATFYFTEGLLALRSLGADTSSFIATGGGAKSDAWLQIKADIFGLPFVRPRITEAGVLGAALLAGLGSGVYAGAAGCAEVAPPPDRIFEPDPRRHSIYTERAELYRELFSSLYPLLKRMNRLNP